MSVSGGIFSTVKRKIELARTMKNQGYSNVEIGRRLGINESTVRDFLTRPSVERETVAKSKDEDQAFKRDRASVLKAKGYTNLEIAQSLDIPENTVRDLLRSDVAEPKLEIEKRVERLELAVGTLAQWLVQAQTGFSARDAEGIEKILRGDTEPQEPEGDASEESAAT
jgi:DNA-binding CsgD family transcriptional regulator